MTGCPRQRFLHAPPVAFLETVEPVDRSRGSGTHSNLIEQDGDPWTASGRIRSGVQAIQRLSLCLFDHLDGEPGEFAGRDVLGRVGGLASDKLEVFAELDVDDPSADALHAGFALAIEGYP
jgi:hypothetical protein